MNERREMRNPVLAAENILHEARVRKTLFPYHDAIVRLTDTGLIGPYYARCLVQDSEPTVSDPIFDNEIYTIDDIVDRIDMITSRCKSEAVPDLEKLKAWFIAGKRSVRDL